MKVALETPQDYYYRAVKGMLNVLLPDLDVSRVGEQENPELVVSISLSTEQEIKVKSELNGSKDLSCELQDREILHEMYTEDDFKRRSRALVKLSVYQVLCSYLEQEMSPWGILVGVRPTKIGHFLLDKGADYSQIDWILEHAYGVAGEKRQLLLEVIKKERSYLPTKREAKQKVGLYIGIPFCPTRCDYCSFAAYPLGEYKDYLTDFMETLQYEIKQLGAQVKELNLAVDLVYIGGGTPTVLTAEQLEQLLSWLEASFQLADLQEFTVEAGRPDTITREKLKLLREAGVERISINPQTMNQATLDRIGREHTVTEVQQAVKLARQEGFRNINMDLIVGLPGEAEQEISHTVEEIRKLAPASITAHTLTIKRAAELEADEDSLPTPPVIKAGLKQLEELAADLSLEPYYMYRQKGSLGNFENVGYAQPGLESIYNILMMEERITILGLGGGAVSKFVDPGGWSLEREVNPKFPAQYIQEINQRTETKTAKLTSLVK